MSRFESICRKVNALQRSLASAPSKLSCEELVKVVPTELHEKLFLRFGRELWWAAPLLNINGYVVTERRVERNNRDVVVAFMQELLGVRRHRSSVD